jgi:hypothetical protein
VGKVYEPPAKAPRPLQIPGCGHRDCTKMVSGYGLVKAPKGSVWQCDLCGTYWHKTTKRFSDGGVYASDEAWYKVRWYHFTARKNIKDIHD